MRSGTRFAKNSATIRTARSCSEFSSRLIPPMDRPREDEEVASWFFCDAQGLSMVRVPESRTIGKNYAWRSFFHGGPRDMDESWRPEPGNNLKATSLSAVFRSQATSKWVVAISTPVFDESSKKKFLGVVAMTVEVGRLVESLLHGGERQFAVLVDTREGDNPGVILQHPLFDKLLAKQGELPDRFQKYRVTRRRTAQCARAAKELSRSPRRRSGRRGI